MTYAAPREGLEAFARVTSELRRREERAAYEGSLRSFVQASWSAIDSSEFQSSWAIDALCEHLEAVTLGQIKRLLINFPPRCGKPVAHDMLILERYKGFVRLDAIVVGDEVLTHKGNWGRVSEVHRQGLLPIVRIGTQTGRNVEAALDHPFWTPNGWVEAGKLRPDDVLGVVPPQTPCGANTMSAEEARLLGYIVGDGNCIAGTPNVTCADDDTAIDIVRCVEAAGFSPKEQRYRMAGNGYWLRRISIRAVAHDFGRGQSGYRGPVKRWLGSHGLEAQSSYTKLVPPQVMIGSDAVVANFIGAYWSCDGHITARGKDRRDLLIACDSVNRAFLAQMQLLLGRMGIESRLRQKVHKNLKTKKQGDQYVSYTLSLRTQDDCYRFAHRIPMYHSKRERLRAEYRRRFDFDRPIWGDIITSVESAGEKECLCLTVEGDHSFTANGFAVHNSNVASVAWPAWVWTRQQRSFVSGPQVRFLCGSYGHTLSLKLSNSSRRLLTSPFYQRYWGDRFDLMGDQNAKHQYDNTEGGTRIATSVGGTLIGLGGDVLLVDDPHNTESVESDADRETVLHWWKELRSTRLNDPKRSAIACVMQRLHEQDVSGVIIDDGEDWTHLMLPMRHDPTRHCVTVLKWDDAGEPEQVWEDPRDPDGADLMWPERYGEPEVKMLETELGPYMASGRLQQSPKPAGGGIIKSEWWLPWEEASFPPMTYRWATVDTAYTEKEENDPSGFTCWGLWHDKGQPKVMLLSAWRKRLEIHGPNTWKDERSPSERQAVVQQWKDAAWRQYRAMGGPQPVIDINIEPWASFIATGENNVNRWPNETRELWVLRTQSQWGLCEWLADSCRRFSVDKLLIENKASGISVAQELSRLHGGEGWGIELTTPEGDKVARLYSVQASFSAGLVYAPVRDWADLVINEVSNFPKGRYKDLTDATSAALKHVRDLGLLVRPEERHFAEEMMARHKPVLTPLYPGTM